MVYTRVSASGVMAWLVAWAWKCRYRNSVQIGATLDEEE